MVQETIGLRLKVVTQHQTSTCPFAPMKRPLVYPCGSEKEEERNMSEAELFQYGSTTWSNTIGLTALFLTVLSGYLITAYVAGSNLSSSQITIINGSYVLVAGLLVFSIYLFGATAIEVDTVAFEMSTQRKNRPIPEPLYALVTIYGALIFASLKFMWDVRHHRPE